MPIRGLRDINNIPVPLEQIDYIRDAARFNCSPATLALLKGEATKREGIDFSASQLGTTTRQFVLRSRDYYPPTAQAMSAHMGTIKHQQVNIDRPGLIVEKRLTSHRDPRISGQFDQFAITGRDDDGTLRGDLYDLKNVKWYSTTLTVKNVWKNHPEYAWQLNMLAALIEEEGLECPTCDGTTMDPDSDNFDGCRDCRGQGRVSARVENLYLECIPPDASYKHAQEARKLGIPEYQKVIVPIDRKSADETYEVFIAAMALRDEAIKAGYAPLCKDRWSNSQIDNLRCRHYCDVQAECIAFSHDRGEAHPIAPLELALEASITAAEARS